MWCDNCLLLFPLRAGAMAWGVLILLYSLVGGILFFKWGPFLFFVYPEWQIYGGISMFVAAAAAINVLALSNDSYLWSRVCKFLWPFIIIISGIRAIIILFELNRGKDNIIWECQNGQIWGASANAGYASTTSFPDEICGPGFSSLFTAFIVGLLVDLGFQIYMFFLNWRFTKRIEHYEAIKGITYGDI